tara:strand:- start:73927 stop:74655 length:729 start_codon:yes stop_codon:yes gene_type:complete
MTSIPKWDEARTDTLRTYVGDETPISIETVAGAAESLETSTRSVAAKLRKLGYEVEKVSTTPSRTFTGPEEQDLHDFLVANEDKYTFEEIAGAFAGGKFSGKQIQGKVLSMELTHLVKPTEKKVYERTYTDAEEAVIIKMANGGSFLEDIAEAVGKTVQSVRGKALSLLRQEKIEAIPSPSKVAKAEDPFQGLNVADFTVAEVAEKIGKTERGVKTMLTRRGLVAKDYDGAAKAAKAAKAAA